MARPRSTGPQTREAILDVALELFSTKGYEATSLRDIADRLGISKAALYYYFAHKQDILVELHLRMHTIVRELLERLETIPDGPQRYAAWPVLIEQLSVTVAENRELMLLHMSNEPAIQSLDLDDRNREANQEMYEKLQAMVASPKVPLELRARMVGSMALAVILLLAGRRLFPDVPDQQIAELVKPLTNTLLRPAAELGAATDTATE